MSFSRAFQWYHSHLDPIWPDGTFKLALLSREGSLNSATADEKGENVLFVCRLITVFFLLYSTFLAGFKSSVRSSNFLESQTNFSQISVGLLEWPLASLTRHLHTFFHGLVRKNTLNPLFNFSVKMKLKQAVRSSGVYPLLRQSLQN
jgi:hypothetical protein